MCYKPQAVAQTLCIMPTSPPLLFPPVDAHTIADVARETGIQKDTLRVWERRYGFPVPSRDALGERRYGADQLSRLRQIKRLLDAGHRPGGVVALPPEALAQHIESLSAAAQPGARSTGARGGAPAASPTHAVEPSALDSWMGWLRDGQVDTLHQALGQHALKHGMVHTVDRLLGPLGHAVGEAWLGGTITVYQEHLFTEAVQRFLQESLLTADRQHPTPRAAPRVLLTTLPGEQHTLGLLMAESMLALEGCERRSLGRDTPVADVVQAVAQWHIDVVALSVSALPSASSVWGPLGLLRETLPASVSIWVGGASPHLRRRHPPDGIHVFQSVEALALQVQAWRSEADIPQG